MPDLFLHNSLTRRKERFEPLDPSMCGCTSAARRSTTWRISATRAPMVVFDVLARLLRRLYPRVTYVRNITDVEDKINARAAESGEPIAAITARTTADFHADMAALGCLPPDKEPRATDHIAEMIAIIERLIDSGHAYAAEGHVLFAVAELSRRTASCRAAARTSCWPGARIDVAPYKRDPGDFVLWKPSTPDLPGWDSPWGRGRPGWHIECCAMSWRYLGETFDIHGGGTRPDLSAPRERAGAEPVRVSRQPFRALLGAQRHAAGERREDVEEPRQFLHRLRDVLAKAPGEAIRLLLLRTHYRSTLGFLRCGAGRGEAGAGPVLSCAGAVSGRSRRRMCRRRCMDALCDDLNTPLALSAMHALADRGAGRRLRRGMRAARGGRVLGLLQDDPGAWFRGGTTMSRRSRRRSPSGWRRARRAISPVPTRSARSGRPRGSLRGRPAGDHLAASQLKEDVAMLRSCLLAAILATPSPPVCTADGNARHADGWRDGGG